MGINDIFALLNEIKNLTTLMQGQRLNEGGYKMLALKIENLAIQSEREIFEFLLRMQAAGVPIEPTGK